MNPRVYRILVGLVLFILVAAVPAGGAAAAHLNWRTVDVYFNEAGQPVIVGYFVNDGTVPVDKVNFLRQQLYLQKGDDDYFLAAAGGWQGIDLYLRPGEASGRFWLRFADYSGPVYNFDRWQTRGDVNYRIAPEIEI